MRVVYTKTLGSSGIDGDWEKIKSNIRHRYDDDDDEEAKQKKKTKKFRFFKYIRCVGFCVEKLKFFH